MTEISPLFDDAAPWGGLSYRFTAFFKDLESVPEGEDAFRGFFGAPHVEKTEKPAEFTEVFHLGDHRRLAQMIRTPRKLDFIIMAPSNVQFEGDKVQSISQRYCDGELAEFREGIGRFLATHAHSCCRLAVGADLGVQVPDRESGYRVLGGRLLTLKPDSGISNELSYQINYPRAREFDGVSLKINRLAVWRCSRTRIEFNSNETMIAEDIYHARVSLDVNSDASFDTSSLKAESQVDLVNTFFDFVSEIAEKGETP